MPDLLSSLLGNGVVLLAALIGFWGVIYSQRKLAKMAAEQRSHEVQASKVLAEAERIDELNSFVNAMLGELAALRLALANSLKLLTAQIAMADELARQGQGRKTQPRIAFRFVTPVFDSHVSRIGILSPELSFKVSSLYGQIKAFAANIQEQVPELEPSVASQVMTSVKNSLTVLDKEIEELQGALNSQNLLRTDAKK